MEGLLYFDICALIIIVTLMFSVIFRKMTQGLTNQIFLVLVVTCLIATLLDIFREVYQGSNVTTTGMFIGEMIVTYGYFIFRGLNAVVYIVYLISLTDTWQKLQKSAMDRFCVGAPFLMYLLVLIINIPTGWMFYFDEQKNYMKGDFLYVLQFCMLFYIIYGIYYVWRYRILFSLGKLLSVFSMFPLILVSIILQMIFPDLLVEMFATVLAILILIITVQRPEENINPFFGVRNYQAYWNDLRRTFYNKKKMDILYIHVLNYDVLINTLGEEAARELLKMSIPQIKILKKKYNVRADIYYLNHGNLAVFITTVDGIDKTDVFANDLSNVLKHDTSIRKSGLSLVTQICILRCQEDVNNFKAASMIYNVLRNHNDIKGDVIYASEIMRQSGYEIKTHIDAIINNALEQRKFKIHYQPIYSVKQKKFISAEALVRLYDDEYGYIPPDIFIPAAEKNGAINQIGIVVLEEVCRFIKSDEFEKLELEYIEINLSVAQCMQPTLAKDLLEILHKYDVAPNLINLEITETALENSYDIMMNNLNELAKAGLTFALDDYGTGFSNIQRIITMPLNIVKLDKSFIDEIDNPDYQIIITNTIKMLKDLNLKILSEGVEGEKQLGFLNKHKCDYIQGFYFSKPLPEDEFIQFICRNK